jgi:hypothetical protein
MLSGLIFSAPKLEIKSSASATYTSPADAYFPAYTSFYYTADYVTMSAGCGVGVTLRRADTLSIDETYLSVNCGPVSWTNTISGTLDCELIAVVNGFQIFEVDGAFRVLWSSIDVKVNGSTVTTLGSGAVNGGMVSVPSSIPLFGIAPIVGVDPSVYGFTGTNTGGFRYLHRTAYRTFPVTLNTVGSLGLSCPATAPDVVPSGDNTWSMVAKGAFPAQSWSWVGAWPDLSKSLVRFPASYEALVTRFGFPKCERFAEESCAAPSVVPDPPYSVVVNQTDELYPRLTQYLQDVQNATGTTIEEPFGYATYAPYYSNATGRTTSGSPTYTNKKIQYFPSTIDTMLDNSQMCNGLAGHPENLVRLWNTWANPHWSFALWFPPDTASTSVRWDLLGSDSDIDYWYQVRQQHATHPSLPSGENTRRRVNVTTEPITQNRIQVLAETLLGLPQWWGICRFDIEDETFPTSFTTDSTSATRYTFKDGVGSGTGSVGSTITLTTGDAIEFDMSSFTVFPYMTTTLSDRLSLTWTDANIASIKVFVVGVDSTIKQIGPSGGVVSGTTYRIPFGTASKWATSAGSDFGSGYLTDDYTPNAGVTASDITAATLADAERISNFNLLPGFSPAKIRIEITRAGAYTGAVSIQHPTFYMAPWTDAQVFHENGHFSTILFKNGPMVRYGVLNYYNWLLDAPINVPTPTAEVFTKTTIGDLWCWENNFLRGKDALDGLATRMAAEYVEDEEYPAGVTKHLWRYKDEEGAVTVDSLSGVVRSEVGPRFWYLNSYRSLPPLAHMPEPLRETADGWIADGAYSQVAFSDICNQQPHIVPGNIAPQLWHASADHLGVIASPEGWTAREFSGPVDNNESQDWVLKWNGTEWFSMRPWRGTANVFKFADAAFGRSYIVQDYFGRLHIAYIKDNDVWYKRSEDTRSAGGFLIDVQVSTSGDVLKAAFDYDAVFMRFELYYQTTTNEVFYTYTTDDGSTWEAPVSIGTDMVDFFTATNHNNDDRFRCWFEFDSGTSGPGTAKGQYRRAGESSWSSEFTFESGGSPISVAEGGMCNVASAFSNLNEWTWCPMIDGESSPSAWFSTDEGRTWTRQP